MFRNLMSFLNYRHLEPTKEPPYIEPYGDLWWALLVTYGTAI